MSLKSGLIILVVIGLLAGSIFTFLSFTRGTDTQGLHLKVEVTDEILVGVPFTAKVTVSNDSRDVLVGVRLALELPETIVFVGSSPDKRIDNKDVGNIDSNSSREETFRLMALGEENSVQNIKATVGYQPSALSSRFEKSTQLDLLVGSAGVFIDLASPQSVYNGENFELTFSYRNISTVDFPDLQLRAVYPEGFNFLESSKKVDQGNNVWRLGDVQKGSEGKFTVKGNVSDTGKSFFDFQLLLESTLFGQTYAINEKMASIKIATSPFNLKLALVDKDQVVYPGVSLSYRLTYSNESEDPLKDAIIKVRFPSEFFDILTVRSNGVLNARNELVWDAGTVPGLSLINPHSGGNVAFAIRLRDYQIRRLNDKNFTIRVDAEIDSPTVPRHVTSDRTIGTDHLETKIGGRYEFFSKGYFRDAVSGVLNQGPIPPKVGQPTEYTIHWQIKNYATDITNFDTQTTLGPNVRFVGVVGGNATSVPQYVDRERKLTWHVDRVIATKGVIDEPLETIFKVELTPAINQVGRPIILVDGADSQVTDDFTGLILHSRVAAVTTSVPDDLTIRRGIDDRVEQ